MTRPLLRCSETALPSQGVFRILRTVILNAVIRGTCSIIAGVICSLASCRESKCASGQAAFWCQENISPEQMGSSARP
jgi:hypothetical protein